MKIEPVGPPDAKDAKTPLPSRLVWFVTLWIGGALAVALVSYFLRALIMP